MKQIRVYTLVLALLLAIGTSCKDDSIELIPKWESAVHGLAEVTSTNTDFLYNDPSIGLDFDLQWISIDGKASVTRIEVFALFNEEYVDGDGNVKVAKHGGEEGRSFVVYEGSAVPANRTFTSFSLSQAELYALYQDVQFDYDGPAKDANGENTGPCVSGCKPMVSVFNNPDKPQRDSQKHFMWDDAIKIRWEFTTEDGRLFYEWAPSVCNEFPGANCSLDVGVVCASEIEEPAGDWVIDMVDTYGDGWQGGYISVIIDGEEAQQVGLPNGGPSAGQEIISVPATATSLEFEWSDDDFNVECEFTITSPKGNVVADVVNPTAGPIKLNLCLE